MYHNVVIRLRELSPYTDAIMIVIVRGILTFKQGLDKLFFIYHSQLSSRNLKKNIHVEDKRYFAQF